MEVRKTYCVKVLILPKISLRRRKLVKKRRKTSFRLQRATINCNHNPYFYSRIISRESIAETLKNEAKVGLYTKAGKFISF